MKAPLLSLACVLATSLLFLPISLQLNAANSYSDAIDVLRETYQGDRQSVVAEALQLSTPEADVFWPLYRAYRVDMEKLGDELVKLVLEYADAYPDVPEDRARELLKQYVNLEKKLASKRASYFKKASKKLSPATVLRWAQIENRLDLVLRLQMASGVPLFPKKTTN